MHDRGVVHRDLKPDNIMFSDEKQVKIVDFGLSTVLAPGEYSTICCGSIAFSAPEVLLGEPYDQKADVWSLGAILHLLLTRLVAFMKRTTELTKLAIATEPFDTNNIPAWSNLSPEGRDLISQILSSKSPATRPSVS